ncbi:MAG: ribonuclease III [Bacillota bacterium]|nr:ribonuclease III [Bacillota bacterium]
MRQDLMSLEERLGYRFSDRRLLTAALTHSSYVRENDGQEQDNERLEFLGDAFFDAVIGEELFHMFPNKEEGFLSRVRATIVCERSLAEKAGQIGLGGFLRLGHGEEKTGGRQRSSVLADAMEAVMGAVYLDGGFDQVRRMTLALFAREIGETARGHYQTHDYKTRLQEVLQARGITDIRYAVLKEDGPDHDKTFTTGLYVGGQLQSEGTGKSKKEAQQQAARNILERENGNVL